MLVKNIFDKIADKDDGGAPVYSGTVPLNAQSKAKPAKKRCVV